jgi:ABC-2 type transport system permease protein
VLTFAGMLLMTMVFFVKGFVGRQGDSGWTTALTHVSYIDLWINSVEGVLQPNLFLFHLSAAIFWLFVTVKVLESRKWR